jgi:hypothetical protein
MARARRAPEPPVFTFRVRLPGRSVSRDIEVAANQPLRDLGDFIPAAFDFTDAHLWSFFLSGKAWDRASEYARQGRAARMRVDEVPFPGARGGREFLFLFDYGDQWHFGVKLTGVSKTLTPGATYPRVVAGAGEPPPQYPDPDEA